MTVGPWKPILIHTYESRISDVDIRTSFNGDSISLDVDLDASPAIQGEAVFNLKGLDKTFKADIDKNGHAKATLSLSTNDVELWFPVGYGGQKLYELEASIQDQVRDPRLRKYTYQNFTCYLGQQGLWQKDAQDWLPRRQGCGGQARRPGGSHIPVRDQYNAYLLWRFVPFVFGSAWFNDGYV
jgi:hypothetical protein